MTTTAYYNENDPAKAEWLRGLISRGLIARGDVDERSITDVQPNDLGGYRQCHFFAGISGWCLALQIAGFPNDYRVWTGSPPCRPFSPASRGRANGLDCSQHLWPAWHRLVDACRPPLIVGEQVPSRAWVDAFCDGVEGMGYAVWAAILPAYSAAKDHARERFYFACHADGYGKPVLSVNEQVARLSWSERDCESVVLPNGFPCRVAYDGFGDAIVPEVAAAFIQAYCEVAI